MYYYKIFGLFGYNTELTNLHNHQDYLTSSADQKLFLCNFCLYKNALSHQYSILSGILESSGSHDDEILIKNL